MSSRRNALEEYVANKFKKIYKYARPTIMSGAGPEAGDVKNPFFTTECKIRNTKSFSVKSDVWHKLRGEAAGDGYKDALYVIQNVDRDRLAILDLDDFFNLLVELVDLRNELQKR